MAKLRKHSAAWALRRDDEDSRGAEGQCLATARKGIESKSRGIDVRRCAVAVKGQGEEASGVVRLREAKVKYRIVREGEQNQKE